MKKKIIALVLASVMMLSILAGCGTVQLEVEVDESKAVITVATWDGGLGSQWLEDAAVKFEQLYADATHFQEGKVGVDVQIVASRSFDGSSMAFTPLTHDIYFVEAVDYYGMINNGQFADMTKVMTTPLTTYGESGTIAEKLDPALDTYLTSADGNYYAVPFYESFYSFAYDLDLWDAKSFYFAADGGWTDASGELAAGPDGETGTYDDGMPATYADLDKLIVRIRDAGIIPFVTCANGQDYVANLMYEFLANYEGKEQMMLNYTFDGVATDLITVAEDGTVTELEDTVITTENGYLLQRQAGRYAVLQMVEDIMLSSEENHRIIDTHTNAQKAFVRGGIANDTTIAMIVEGSWWENEAKTSFADLENSGYERHNYAVMPMPHATEDKIGQKPTWLAMSDSYGFIASNCDNITLAEEFMMFLHTDENLSAFTGEVDMTRALNYQISDADAAEMSTYAKSILELKANSDVIYPISTQDIVIDNITVFGAFNIAWRTNINGYEERNPWLYFKDVSDSTAEKYFAGQYKFFETKWTAF